MTTDQREAKRAYNAAWYQDHREAKLAYTVAHIAAYRATHREELRDKDVRKQQLFLGNLRILKTAQGCDDCGTSEGLLDHHHTDPAMKRYTVSEMYHNSLEKFINEIAKCTVLCRSCHKKRHVEMRAA